MSRREGEGERIREDGVGCEGGVGKEGINNRGNTDLCQV